MSVLDIVMMIGSGIACGFAWAIGGEHGFGRWRRGVIVGSVACVIGLIKGVSWWVYPAIGVMSWAVYQGLFYDECIQMVWGMSRSRKSIVLGILGLVVNGAMCGAMAGVMADSWVRALEVMVVSGEAFAIMCIMSNEFNVHMGSCRLWGRVKVWCPADSWWLAEFGFGLVLGGLLWIA